MLRRRRLCLAALALRYRRLDPRLPPSIQSQIVFRFFLPFLLFASFFSEPPSPPPRLHPHFLPPLGCHLLYGVVGGRRFLCPIVDLWIDVDPLSIYNKLLLHSSSSRYFVNVKSCETLLASHSSSDQHTTMSSSASSDIVRWPYHFLLFSPIFHPIGCRERERREWVVFFLRVKTTRYSIEQRIHQWSMKKRRRQCSPDSVKVWLLSTTDRTAHFEMMMKRILTTTPFFLIV